MARSWCTLGWAVLPHLSHSCRNLHGENRHVTSLFQVRQAAWRRGASGFKAWSWIFSRLCGSLTRGGGLPGPCAWHGGFFARGGALSRAGAWRCRFVTCCVVFAGRGRFLACGSRWWFVVRGRGFPGSCAERGLAAACDGGFPRAGAGHRVCTGADALCVGFTDVGGFSGVDDSPSLASGFFWAGA